MCGYKKIKIEYIMMAVAFASVVWSIFAGFRISRFQWLFVMGSVIWFLGMCRLLDQNKRNIVVMVVICIIYCMLAHRQLINGFQIINNKMAEALNQSMDLGFYYYISVTLEHSRRDSVLAVLFFVLVAGIVLGILRCRPLTLFLTTGLMEMTVLMIAPYGISAAFFLFLGSWIVYFSIRKGKKGFAAGLYIMFLAAAVPLFFYDQTNVPTDTMIKRNILIQIREWTQGKGYLAVGGIGNGKLRSVGEVSPKGEKLFLVYAPENADLYLKGFVSGRYKDGEWTKEKKNTLVYGGEMAQELPYLFPDLSMQDFAVYQKGYIQTPKDIAFSEKREIKIHYQKMQESFLLIPYFSDASRINGNVAGDSVIERNTADTEYTTSYYQIKNNKNLLDISQRFDVMSVLKNAGELEKNYVRSMQEYGTYVQQNYLEIPEEIKKTIKQLSCHVNKENSILYNIEEIQKFLKNNYQYTYRPGLTGQDKDPVNEFLTERKRGFCTQFASAAVFLFREAGIPARYVEGYKIRADQWRLGKAQVTDYEAHAWTEIYIEHIGWIPVEVTGRDTGESVYKHVEQEEKQRNAIVPNKKQFVTNVKKIFQMIPIVIILAVIFAFIKLLQKKRKWNQMTNKEKVLFYEKQLEKYAENGAKSRNNSNSMTSEIIEKARYSNKDITRHELNLVKRHLDLLKRKNKNVTKILTKLK